jgi:N-acetylneuraminate synthase
MSKTFIIAEAGVNHNGNIKLAYDLIDAAATTGADAVKFQTFISTNEISSIASKADYQINATGTNESQLEMCQKLELAFSDFKKLQTYCEQKGILFLSSCFCFDSVDFINDIVPIHKTGSGELTNLPYLKHVAKKGKPIILATGMSTLTEVATAIDTIQNNQPDVKSAFPSLSLLHCVTNYPTAYEDVNLKAMETMKQAFQLPVGFSDHTLGTETSIAAVALGACIIEKHFTLDKTMSGPDHSASLEPDEFTYLVQAIRNIEQTLGDGIKKPADNEKQMITLARRSLVAEKALAAGTVITNDCLGIKRPATGIQPADKENIIGLTLTKTKQADEPLQWEDFK